MTIRLASTALAGAVVALAFAGAASAKDRPQSQPGQPSVLVTIGAGGDETLDCPSAEDPKRKCSTHAIAWEAAPTAASAAEVLKSANRKEGVSLMECSAGADGALINCAITGDTPEPTKQAMSQLAGEFRAPATAVDGTPMTDGRILTSWDWSAIMKAVRKASK